MGLDIVAAQIITTKARMEAWLGQGVVEGAETQGQQGSDKTETRQRQRHVAGLVPVPCVCVCRAQRLPGATA